MYLGKNGKLFFIHVQVKEKKGDWHIPKVSIDKIQMTPRKKAKTQDGRVRDLLLIPFIRELFLLQNVSLLLSEGCCILFI